MKCPESIEELKTYFVFDGSCTKIGRARNVDVRLRLLQTGNPNNLIVDIVIFADVELLFHEYFKNFKVQNEWFDLPDNYKEIVKEMCKYKNLKVWERHD